MKTVAYSFILTLIFTFLALPALAFPSLIPAECSGSAELDTTKCKDCSLDQEDRTGCCCNLSSVERTAVNVSQIILGVTGSIALLMFVIGGVMYIISGGSPDKVKKATDVLKNSAIGIAIILLAGLAVQILLKKLTS